MRHDPVILQFPRMALFQKRAQLASKAA